MGLYFMLFAGAGADNIPSYGGALTFVVNGPPSWANWVFGSAFF